jgi:four helix bundle protein
MEKSKSIQFNEQVRERTMKMAVDVRNLFVGKKIHSLDRDHILQLLRSSSSVAANYRAATRGRSDAEFFSKICIVVEESDETLFWIEFLTKSDVVGFEETRSLRDELDQLVRLFSTIRKKMKLKLEGKIS